MRSSARRRTRAESRRCASSERATTSSPEVSRSSRWTMPGRPGSPPATTPASESTSVPAGRPAPGWTTSPAGLSTTARCSSCQTISAGGPAGGAGAGSTAAGSSIRSPPSSRWLFGRDRPVDERAPLERPLGRGPGAEMAGEEAVEPLSCQLGGDLQHSRGEEFTHLSRFPTSAAAPPALGWSSRAAGEAAPPRVGGPGLGLPVARSDPSRASARWSSGPRRRGGPGGASGACRRRAGRRAGCRRR